MPKPLFTWCAIIEKLTLISSGFSLNNHEKYAKKNVIWQQSGVKGLCKN